MFHWPEGSRGRDGGSQRRSPLDVIMSQIRRKRTSSDRKPLGRFLSWSSDRTGIPENGETEVKEEKGNGSSRTKKAGKGNTSEASTMADVLVCVSAAGEAADGERDLGWGRVCLFLQKLGKKVDSRSLSLAHCDLTATDLLELGAQPSPLTFISFCPPFSVLSSPNQPG